MDRLKEIEVRKLEIRELLEDENQEVDLNAIKEELAKLEAEIKEIEDATKQEEEVTEEEQKEEETEVAETEEAEATEAEARREVAKSIEERKILGTEIKKEEIKMEEKRFDVSSPEYRTAWAKKLMGKDLNELDKRALGDAITTTATTFVEADADTHGINNGGLLIPTSVRTEILNLIEKKSPFFRDIRKLQVNGNVDLPFVGAADDAQWGTEGTDSVQEGIEFKRIQLTGHELYKDVVITWKLEEMAVESFINFIIEELANKMGRALCDAVLNGNGSGKPTGALNGLDAVTTGETVLDCIMNTYASLGDDAKVGAKAYISPACGVALYGYKGNNNYPFINGLKETALFEIEVDPYLTGNNILVGNPMNYVLNENTALRVDKEVKVLGRKVIYGGYMVVDGAAKTSSFAKGTYTPSASV